MLRCLKWQLGRPGLSALQLFGLVLLTEAALIAQGTLPASSGHLRLLILQGFGATNYLKSQQAVVPVVAVLDEDDRPVEGATVVFELPATGPGASFEGGRFSLTTATNAQGQAVAAGFRSNGQAGQFIVRVAAIWNGKNAAASFTQTNSFREVAVPSNQISSRAGKSHKKLWVLVAVVASAGAGGGYYYSSRNTTAVVKAPTITVQPGPVVVGAP